MGSTCASSDAATSERWISGRRDTCEDASFPADLFGGLGGNDDQKSGGHSVKTPHIRWTIGRKHADEGC